MTLGNLKGLIAGAGLGLMIVAGSAGSASADCATPNFVSVGCFETTNIVSLTSSTLSNFIGITSTGNTPATLTLSGSDTPISGFSFDFRSMNPYQAFAISIIGFVLPGGASSLLVAANDTSLHQNVVFYAQNPASNILQLAFSFTGPNPTRIEIGNLVVNAPAPLPGAGFLSFLGLAFAGMWRRGRSVAARIMGRREAATA